MSVADNKAAILRVSQEAFSDGHVQVIDEICADEYEFDYPSPEDGEGGVVVGHESYKQYVLAFRAAFRDPHVTLIDVIGEGDCVAARIFFSGFHDGPFAGFRPINKHVTVTGMLFARFVEGRIRKTWCGFTNITEVLAAASG